jgi:hypothetical protein
MIVVGLTLTDISPAFRMLPNPLQYRATITTFIIQIILVL